MSYLLEMPGILILRPGMNYLHLSRIGFVHLGVEMVRKKLPAVKRNFNEGKVLIFSQSKPELN